MEMSSPFRFSRTIESPLRIGRPSTLAAKGRIVTYIRGNCSSAAMV
jgi:hypothetical protein